MNHCKFLALIALFLITIAPIYSSDYKLMLFNDIVVYSTPKDTAFARVVIARLQERIDAFQMKLGVYLTEPLFINILPNKQEYRLLTAGKGKIVESSEAFYSPSDNRIFVRSPDQIPTQRYDTVLMHEYIHWYLDQLLLHTPLWFHEGMAYYYSGQYGFMSYYEFTRYLFMGYRLSLRDMVYDYPADKSRWNMFYLTSAFAVKYMDTRHNKQWQMFWDYVASENDARGGIGVGRPNFNHLFRASFYKSLSAFSSDFDKVLKRYAWQFPLVGINAIIFSLLPFVVIASWLRQRRKLSEMPEPEPVQPEPAESGLSSSDPDNNTFN